MGNNEEQHMDNLSNKEPFRTWIVTAPRRSPNGKALTLRTYKCIWACSVTWLSAYIDMLFLFFLSFIGHLYILWQNVIYRRLFTNAGIDSNVFLGKGKQFALWKEKTMFLTAEVVVTSGFFGFEAEMSVVLCGLEVGFFGVVRPWNENNENVVILKESPHLYDTGRIYIP